MGMRVEEVVLGLWVCLSLHGLHYKHSNKIKCQIPMVQVWELVFCLVDLTLLSKGNVLVLGFSCLADTVTLQILARKLVCFRFLHLGISDLAKFLAFFTLVMWMLLILVWLCIYFFPFCFRLSNSFSPSQGCSGLEFELRWHEWSRSATLLYWFYLRPW